MPCQSCFGPCVCALRCIATFLVALCGLHFMYLISMVQIVSQSALRDASHTHCISKRCSGVFLQYCNEHWNLWALRYFRIMYIEEQEYFRKSDKRKNMISLIYISGRIEEGTLYHWSGSWSVAICLQFTVYLPVTWLRYQVRNLSSLITLHFFLYNIQKKRFRRGPEHDIALSGQ